MFAIYVGDFKNFSEWVRAVTGITSSAAYALLSDVRLVFRGAWCVAFDTPLHLPIGEDLRRNEESER
jgi:hypothetical protein